MSLNRTATGVVGLFLLVIFIVSCGSSDVQKAKEFMAAEMYLEAIELLKKRIIEKPTDVEAHFLLATVSLYTDDYEEAKKRFSSVVSLDPEQKNKVADECLKFINQKKLSMKIYSVLWIADKYAIKQETKKAVGQKEKELALSIDCKPIDTESIEVSSLYNFLYREPKKDLLERAARHLGEIEVYGFETKRIDDNTNKIIFHTNEPITVIENWETEKSYYFACEDKTTITAIKPSGKSYQMALNQEHTIPKNQGPLVLQSEIGTIIIITEIN